MCLVISLYLYIILMTWNSLPHSMPPNKSSTLKCIEDSCDSHAKSFFMLSLMGNFFMVWIDQWWVLKATQLFPSAVDKLIT